MGSEEYIVKESNVFLSGVKHLAAALWRVGTNLELGFRSVIWLVEIKTYILLNIWLPLGNYCAPFYWL